MKKNLPRNIKAGRGISANNWWAVGTIQRVNSYITSGKGSGDGDRDRDIGSKA
jgi:hypothetical protein